jgi:hypothetical protein
MSVTTTDALVAATGDKTVQRIAVSGHLTNAASVCLGPGQSLRGADDNAIITFAPGADGLQLSSDNRIHNIRLETTPEKRAIFNETSVASLGQIELRGVTTIGRVQILARDKVRGGHVDVNGLDIIAADARGESVRMVMASMFSKAHSRSGTCNRTTASSSARTLSASQPDATVRRFEAAASSSAAQATKAAGSSCGGWRPTRFTAMVGFRRTPRTSSQEESSQSTAPTSMRGPVTTYGVNDMVLDNWGTVDRWIAEDRMTGR